MTTIHLTATTPVAPERIFRQDLAQTLKRLAEESPATALSCASRPEVCPCKAYVSEEFAKEEARKLFVS